MTVANQIVSPRKKLENHLRKLLDDERFFDVSLKCSDSETLRASKNILSVRSEVFNDLIFDKSKESSNQSNDQLEFNQINSVAMKYILEYLYASNNDRETLSVENVIEVYYAAIYFKLEELQEFIIQFAKKTLRDNEDDLGKKLLSWYIEKFTLKADNDMGKLLVDWVAKIQLFPDDAGKDSLVLKGLQYLLDKTYNTTKSFATYELTLFEYTLIKTKHIVLEGKVDSLNPYDMDYEESAVERIKNHLKPLLEYFDLRIIDSDDIIQKMEPLNIFPQNMITNAFRFGLEAKRRNEVFQPMRGRTIFKWKNFDDKSWQSNNNLSIIENGFTVEANSDIKKYQSIIGNLTIKGNGVHRWNILVEDFDENIYIGIYGIGENFDNKPGDRSFQGWALGSDGFVYNKNDRFKFGTRFKKGDTVNINVNMNTKQCFFGVNDSVNHEAFGRAFPNEVYPFISLKRGGKLSVSSY